MCQGSTTESQLTHLYGLSGSLVSMHVISKYSIGGNSKFFICIFIIFFIIFITQYIYVKFIILDTLTWYEISSLIGDSVNNQMGHQHSVSGSNYLRRGVERRRLKISKDLGLYFQFYRRFHYLQIRITCKNCFFFVSLPYQMVCTICDGYFSFFVNFIFLTVNYINGIVFKCFLSFWLIKN